MFKSQKSRRDIIICLVLALFILIIYRQASEFKFVYYDDGAYVTEVPHVMAGLTWEGFKWALTATDAGFWHPITWLSFMIDRELFGNNAGGYHWTNVILHIINTLILYFFLSNATAAPYRSAFVALFFAVHPLHVESVAWVAQRKDLLAALFGFASLWAYVNYALLPDLKKYFLVMFLFVCGLMSKPMIVTFPFVMLLMDYWPLARLKLHTEAGIKESSFSAYPYLKKRTIWFLFLEKSPFVAISLAASMLVVITEQKAQALTGLEILSVTARLSNAVVSYIKYVSMMLWPVDLSFLYLHPVTIPVMHVFGALFALLTVTLVFLSVSRIRPYLLTGWFWYLGTLIPVIGLIQVGPHAMADRYTYIPLVGLFIAIIWYLDDVFSKRPFVRKMLVMTGVAAVFALSCLSWVQAGYWRNSVTLFEHALKVSPTNYIALNNLGSYYLSVGDYDKAIAMIRKAIELRPQLGQLYANLGLAMYARQDYDKAVEYLAKAHQLGHSNSESRKFMEEGIKKRDIPP